VEWGVRFLALTLHFRSCLHPLLIFWCSSAERDPLWLTKGKVAAIGGALVALR